MDSKKIPSSIEKIYDRFLLPKLLRMHMYRVACVAEMVCDNWKGAPIDKDNIVAACLLHDIGNVAKFDLDTQRGENLLAYEPQGLDYWRSIKKRTTSKYGRSDSSATHSMMAELRVPRRIMFLVDHLADVLDSGKDTRKDYELRICEYADERVGPYSVMTVRARFLDFEKRYRRSSSVSNRARAAIVASKLRTALALEKRLFRLVKISPRRINDRSIRPYLMKYPGARRVKPFRVLRKKASRGLLAQR